MDRATPRAEQAGSWEYLYCPTNLSGLQGKEKSLGNTLWLSRAYWWDSPKTELAAQASQTELGLGFCLCPLGPTKREEGQRL